MINSASGPSKPLGPWMPFLAWLVASLAIATGLPAQTTEPAPGEPAESPAQPAADAPAGHSQHGEVFNEGPRQRAYLMDGCGPVKFHAQTGNEEAAKFIDQGFGQLHGFWYFEAERSFRQAAALDPGCATAYLGMALANLRNGRRGKEFLAEAEKRKQNVSDRERRYIAAYKSYIDSDNEAKKKTNRTADLIKALEEIALAYPDDLEAKAQLALQLYENRTAAGASFLAANALMQEIFQVEPLHPVHHYVIHLWDYKDAQRALTSAGLCGPSAAGIAHMWHMPGHIYSRLKRYHDACWQQEASARVDHAHMMRDRVLPDQIHNFAHNNEWLIRNLIFVGRVQDALDLSKNMLELPRHPAYNTLEKRGCSASYGRLRLIDVLSEYELWEEAIALCDTPYLEPSDLDEEQARRLQLLGAAHFALQQHESGVTVLQQAHDKRRQLETQKRAARDQAVAATVSKAWGSGDRPPAPWSADLRKQVDKAEKASAKDWDGKLRFWEKAVAAIEGFQAAAANDYHGAIAKLKQAGDANPVLLTRLQFLAGEEDQALEAARKRIQSNENEILPLACLIELTWNAGQHDQARAAFEKLRHVSSTIDLRTRPFQRLAPIADALGYPSDWRQPMETASDLGPRPALDDLGPFRWQPSPAPAWELPLGDGKPLSSRDYAGRPHIVVFYLGYGCLHCAEQLQKFAPLAEQFRAQGLDLVAVSSDNREGLRKSQENYQGGPFPFPLVSDESLEVFKAYRAYDDFEQLPLHGTFLVDGAGRVRWQDISFEPFMDAEFLLQEARRLLGDDPPHGQHTAQR